MNEKDAPLYAAVRMKLIEMRKAAGLTQRALAARLGREHSFTARIELGRRRVDVVELCRIAVACGREPGDVMGEVVRTLGRV